MSRIIIPGARAAAPARGRLPPWLKGRASLYLDPTDDRVTGTIPADLTADGAWTILGRLKSTVRVTATNRGAVSFGTNAAAQGAFLGKVVVGGLEYFGGGLIGTVLADSEHCKQADFADCMIRYAGGAGGALTLVVDGRSTSTVATGAIAGVVAELGRLLVAGTCFGGNVSDARVYSRAITDAEYDAWRDGTAEPATTRRFWSCENPGYGTTCREEVGGTDDAITGALWSPVVPFRRQRIVEDVAACPQLNGKVLSILDHLNLRPGAGSWGWMGWTVWSGAGPNQPPLVSKLTGANITIYRTSANRWSLYVVDDAALAKSVIGPMAPPTIPWTHFTAGCDRAVGNLTVSINAGPPSTTAIGALVGINPTGTMLLSGALAFDHGHNDFVWRKGAPFTWEEKEAHYYDGIVPTAPAGSTQIRWDMREGAGTVVASQPAGYNGVLSAASWTTKTRCKARSAA